MTTRSVLKVADEMWVAAVLLQRERGAAGDFTPKEVVERARKEALGEAERPGVLLHAQYHAVASRPPNAGRYRMLTETSRGRRRLYRPGDPYHPARERGKTHPRAEDLPDAFIGLLDWYLKEYAGQTGGRGRSPIEELIEWGRRTRAFQGVDPDEYVRRLREGWDE